MSAPAAKARSLPPSTIARTDSSRSSSASVCTSSSISSSESAFSASGRLSRTTATAPSRSVKTSSDMSALAVTQGQSLGLGQKDDDVAGIQSSSERARFETWPGTVPGAW